MLWTLFCPLCVSLKAASSSSGKDRGRWRAREGEARGPRMPSTKTASFIPPSCSPPAPPPRPPVRSRRKSKSPSSRTKRSTPKRALDLDTIGATSNTEDSRQPHRGSRDLTDSQGSELDRNWEGVALELRCRGSRMRSAVYQTSDLPSIVKVKRQLEPSDSKGQIDRSKVKATFV